jgi:protein-S-isoprenylcysteine O-methyltransferase Ste14
MIYVVPIPALWAAWTLYWGLASFGNKAVRRREPLVSRLGHAVPLTVAALLFVPWHGTPPPMLAWLYANDLPATRADYWTGVALVALGLGFSIWARRRLAGNWSGTVTLKENHELIRSGPYRFVRHPIYSGLLLAFIGSAVATAEWRGVLAVLVVLYAFLRKIRLEERWMVETFGARYTTYRAEVRALVPFLL